MKKNLESVKKISKDSSKKILEGIVDFARFELFYPRIDDRRNDIKGAIPAFMINCALGGYIGATGDYSCGSNVATAIGAAAAFPYTVLVGCVGTIVRFNTGELKRRYNSEKIKE